MSILGTLPNLPGIPSAGNTGTDVPTSTPTPTPDYGITIPGINGTISIPGTGAATDSINKSLAGALLSAETWATALASNLVWDIGFLIAMAILLYVAVAPEVNSGK